MSRSRRKPYFTDQQNYRGVCRSKRDAVKTIRRLDLDDTPANGKGYRKEFESWNIRDWSFHAPKDKRAYRK
jgi:hypothetical protein